MSLIPVIILVDDAADFGETKAACQLHGLTQISMLPRLRILRGLIDPARKSELISIPGVRSVEQERKIQLLPPNSRIE